MINHNQATELRTCQRIKFDQSLYILTMYQKKLRLPIEFDPDTPIDAEKQYEDRILKSWNKKWQNDLTKPLLNCVTSVHPRVLYDSLNDKIANKQAIGFNRIMEKFIQRLKYEHEDESNFKIVEQFIDQIVVPPHKKGKIYLMETLMHFVTTIKSMTQAMQASVLSKQQKLQNLQDTTYCDCTASILEGILQITQNFEEELNSNDQLMQFMYSVMKMFDDLKESEYGATLISAQPEIKQMTFLIHPLFLPIYGNLRRERDEAKRKHEQKEESRHNMEKAHKTSETQSSTAEKPFKHFFSSNTSSFSKTVFLNLDGYESEYNLQFARCLRKNLMYISFPKEDTYAKNDDNSVFEKRFFKRLMYNYEKNRIKSYQNERSSMGISSEKTMEDQLEMEMNERYSLMNDTEDYFINVEKYLYQFQKGYEDLNKHAYIFPLRLHSLQENFNSMKEQDDFILEIYESNVVTQIFKYFLVNEIRQFNPTHIVVSYSGRLRIQDRHFVEIMQQLTKLSNYKVILFPNMTSSFQSSQLLNHNINTKNINYLKYSSFTNQEQNQMEMEDQEQGMTTKTEIEFSLYNKIARFLKISSGNHSLTKYFEEEGSLSKHKNLTVLRKINRLMTILGEEYENIERIRFKNKEIDLIPELYRKDYEKIEKAFMKLIPRYYYDLYEVIEAMITLHQDYKQKMENTLQLFEQFGLSVQGVQDNIEIKQLIEEFKDKIVVRDVVNQNQRAELFYHKIIANLQSMRDKHFLQIAQEKYDESVLLYFRFIDCKNLYEETEEGKVNLRGLIDISFINPNKQSRQILQIFDSTQILYHIDQRHLEGPVPVLIMNHLPIDKKFTPKFQNYCALLNRAFLSEYTNTNNQNEKIYEVRKEKKVYPIKLFDLQGQEINEHRFEFQVQWNYFETERYMVLYWPAMFNMIEAVSCKIRGKVYEAPLLNQFFIGQKKVISNSIHFYQAALPQDIVPRNGCAAYAMNNQIYILGGFYDKSKNYLQLQKDITRVNFEHYDQQNQRKLHIINEKDNLFPIIDRDFREGGMKRRNSYIRVRQEYQFYDLEEIAIDYQEEPGIKNVLMIGGYGQNFLHPYSMLTYYYFILKFRRADNMLISIQKKIIYDNTIPINIRQCSKNMGIIKTNIRSRSGPNQKKITTQPQLTDLDSYARFRVVYSLNQQEGKFSYKFQFIFSEKDIRMHKEELRRINDEKFETGDVSSIRMQKIEGINNKFLADKCGEKQVVHLRMEQSGAEQTEKFITLTNQSVAYLNIVNGNYICAIIKHPLYTKGLSIVAQSKEKSIETNAEDISFVNLRPITDKKLEGDFSLHILMASNMNFFYILHGHRIFQTDKIHEYQVTNSRRDSSKKISQIKPKNPVFPPQIKIRSCSSIFFYHNVNSKNWISCESFIGIEGSVSIYFVMEIFDPMDSFNLRWSEVGKPIPYIFCHKSWNNPVRIERITFLECYKEHENKRRTILLSYNKRKYVARIEDINFSQLTEQIHIMMEQVNEQQIRKLDQLQAYKGIILQKKPDNYVDRGYIS